MQHSRHIYKGPFSFLFTIVEMQFTELENWLSNIPLTRLGTFLKNQFALFCWSKASCVVLYFLLSAVESKPSVETVEAAQLASLARQLALLAAN